MAGNRYSTLLNHPSIKSWRDQPFTQTILNEQTKCSPLHPNRARCLGAIMALNAKGCKRTSQQQKKIKMKPKLIDTTPTIRYVGTIPVTFYSPVQIEAIIPVEKRLPSCKGNSMQPDYSGHYRKPHITGEWNCTSKD